MGGSESTLAQTTVVPTTNPTTTAIQSTAVETTTNLIQNTTLENTTNLLMNSTSVSTLSGNSTTASTTILSTVTDAISNATTILSNSTTDFTTLATDIANSTATNVLNATTDLLTTAAKNSTEILTGNSTLATEATTNGGLVITTLLSNTETQAIKTIPSTITPSIATDSNCNCYEPVDITVGTQTTNPVEDCYCTTAIIILSVFCGVFLLSLVISIVRMCMVSSQVKSLKKALATRPEINSSYTTGAVNGAQNTTYSNEGDSFSKL